jgi:hypothetical protein
MACNQASICTSSGYPQPLPLNFSPYITFLPYVSLYFFIYRNGFPLFFHLSQQFPLNIPLYPTTTIKYHFLYQLLFFYLLTITRGPTAQCLG